ncbi:DUF998 domain-containing protein [Streptosporangium sp. NBC_01755]|uniref:DUF998 domain-containing protein n=1 Tax=unclassified Streptosporangium TaxID=2632669 RepID=UPI002DDBC06C|nr:MULTISPECIES: DUF998 domain-containing protein [unclassified Streptosporangium]WSA25020.1 DUF998 domain-containing protein [Streptosporangium sp. NBC_01810]WSD03649.1 DUF998 domain-containing protein [Streptosporangium sp. NBC_01755]
MLASKRLYPLIACAGIVTAAAAALAAVVGQPDPVSYPDPLDLTISEYVALDRSGITGFVMASLGVASLALVAGLRATGAPMGVLAERLMWVWGAGLIVLGVLPAVLPGTGTDLVGQTYRYVSIAVFVAIPAAGGLLVARFREDERWRPVAGTVEWLALAGGFGLLVITYVALPGHGVLAGLAERILLGAEVALVGVLAARLARLTWARSAAPASRAALG